MCAGDVLRRAAGPASAAPSASARRGEPPPKKCCGICGRRFKLFGHGLCKKKAACALAVCVTPVSYPVPIYVAPTPQAYPTGQASGQGS